MRELDTGPRAWPRLAFTVSETVRLLGLSPATVRRRLESGELDGFKLGGSWLVRRQALADLGLDLDALETALEAL